MAIKLGPNDRLVIEGASPAYTPRSRFGPVKAYLRERIRELKAREEKHGPRWFERTLEARGRIKEVRALLAWISKQENAK